jgi:hypothetical protein
LPSAENKTLGKGSLCRVLQIKHSAKTTTLGKQPQCLTTVNHRQYFAECFMVTLGKDLSLSSVLL